MEKLYAVYSESQSKLTGTFIYKTHDGKEIEVTEVSPNEFCPNNNWPDKIDKGEVISYVRKWREKEKI